VGIWKSALHQEGGILRANTTHPKEFLSEKDFSLKVIADVKTFGKTGVEMEALTAVSISCLTIYDMCKSIDKSIVIKEIKLIAKKGGKSDFKVNK